MAGDAYGILLGITQDVSGISPSATVTQVGATLTLTGGTQSFSTINDSSIAQAAAVLTFTGGIQSFAAQVDAAIAQQAATLTLTGGTQGVSANAAGSISILQVGAQLALSGGVQSVVALGSKQRFIILTDGSVVAQWLPASSKLIFLLDGRMAMRVTKQLYMPL
jgi:hypothetical protein